MQETNETALLLACARTRIEDLDPERVRSLCAQRMDWTRVLLAAASNRLGPLLYRNLRECRADAVVPAEVLAGLKAAYANEVSRGLRLERATRTVLAGLETAGVEALLLRGALVGERVYGDPVLRPYTDLDVMIRRADLPRAKEVLRGQGFGPLSRALDDRYYERHHLHLEYRDAAGASVEIHWALDHPYSLFNIPSEELFRKAGRGTLAGGPARILCPEHLLLTLCVHFVKHAYGLSALLDAPCLAEVMAAQGWLLHLCDVAETLRRHASTLDWPEVARATDAWNIGHAVRPAVLAAVRLLGAPLPAGRLRDGPARRPGWVERKQARVAMDLLSPSASRALAGFRAGLFVRPVRMLDALAYLWPDAAFLAGRYGPAGTLKRSFQRLSHGIRGAGALTRNAVDYLYFSTRRGQR